MKSDSPAAIDESFIACRPEITAKFVVPAFKETAKIDSIAAGSARLDINISLDEPIPPNEFPASRPAKAMKNLPSANTNIIKIKSPTAAGYGFITNTGVSKAARIAEPRTIKGVILNIQDTFKETTSSL